MLNVRPMQAKDVPACTAIINHTISLGGSTAHEEAFTDASFTQEYFKDPAIVNVVEAEGRIVGFQAVFEREPGLYSIGSFADQQSPIKGAGRALAAQTVEDCRAAGGHTILAKITADNTAGLAFYTSVGFSDWQVWPNDHQRPDGRWVDRIVKRYKL